MVIFLGKAGRFKCLEEFLFYSKKDRLLDYGLDDPSLSDRIYELEKLRRYRDENIYDSRHMKSLRNNGVKQ